MMIDNWPMERIMRLPDWCFGRRWQYCLYAYAETGLISWDITEQGLPEVCVLWEWALMTTQIWQYGDWWRLALGNQLPINVAMMDELEPLISGMGETGPEPRRIIGPNFTPMSMRRLRQPIKSAGRKIVLEVNPGAEHVTDLMVLTVFSSIPKEVPDWLISAKAINL